MCSEWYNCYISDIIVLCAMAGGGGGAGPGDIVDTVTLHWRARNAAAGHLTTWLLHRHVSDGTLNRVDCLHQGITIAGPWLGAKSTSKIPDPSKIFVLSYKNILIKKNFHFEASYYGSQHPPLRTSCDTYCSTGLTGNKHKLFGKWSFSAPRAQNWASKVSKTIYLTPGTCLEVLLTSWTPSGCSGRL